VWYALTYDRVIGPFFFDENILDMLENHCLPQLNNNNLILQLDGAPIHFAHTVPDRWIEEEGQMHDPLQPFWASLFGRQLQPLRCPGLLLFCLGVAQVIEWVFFCVTASN
jgi:hypothetical protein